MDPQWIIAICAAAALLITWTGSIATATIWLLGKLDAIQTTILADFHQKHEENSKKVAALETLVIRHNIMLDPEFNGSSLHQRRSKQ